MGFRIAHIQNTAHLSMWVCVCKVCMYAGMHIWCTHADPYSFSVASWLVVHFQVTLNWSHLYPGRTLLKWSASFLASFLEARWIVQPWRWFVLSILCVCFLHCAGLRLVCSCSCMVLGTWMGGLVCLQTLFGGDCLFCFSSVHVIPWASRYASKITTGYRNIGTKQFHGVLIFWPISKQIIHVLS